MILYGKVLSSFKTGNNNLSIKNNKKKKIKTFCFKVEKAIQFHQ